ncbi:hypothetical protein ACOBQB_10750 [Streptomyces sp. G5(2025)]|uniref:hypothetical protein n=1 Tax=Streptomyces sp. G5(2025) TaxID=3406628 RepID=UPI003C27E107
MRLVELSVTNFRSLGDVQGIPIHKQTILTGHNDCGNNSDPGRHRLPARRAPFADSDISQFAESEPARAALPSDDDAAEPIAVTVEGRFDPSEAEKKALVSPLPSRCAVGT